MKRLLLLLNASLLLCGSTTLACQRFGPIVPEEMVARADLIVRATAVEYAKSSSSADAVVQFGRIRFRVDQVVKGHYTSGDLVLRGYLVDTDDFNNEPVPYRFVRPDGRRGSCFADNYTREGEYLLIMKLYDGSYTIGWYALGPTNEQLHSADDPWFKWVANEVAK